jgi:hypothetical protein
MPGSSPHVRAKSKRKKDARQSLADSGRNVQAKDRLALFIPHTVIPRGRHSHNQVSRFRGKGISKNPIPDAMMKKPLDKKCFLVNNVRLKLNSTEKLSRCPHCYVGPFSNLSKHYKDCNVKNSKNNKKLKQAAYLRANHKSTNALNSMIQPTKKLKHSSSSSSSSSSTSSNNNPIPPPHVLRRSAHTQVERSSACVGVCIYMFYFKG